jgi:hypothetical protein
VPASGWPRPPLPREPARVTHGEHDGQEQRAGEEGEQHEGGGDEEVRSRRHRRRAARRGGPGGGGAQSRPRWGSLQASPQRAGGLGKRDRGGHMRKQ